MARKEQSADCPARGARSLRVGSGVQGVHTTHAVHIFVCLQTYVGPKGSMLNAAGIVSTSWYSASSLAAFAEGLGF